MSKRIKYIDLAKGVCILLVILGHQIGWENPLRYVIYSFHMAMFFSLSSMVDYMKGTYRQKSKDFFVNKSKQLLAPYFLWGAVFFLYDVIRCLLKIKPWNRLAIDIIQIFSGYGVNVLWFLSALFLGNLIIFAAEKKIKTTYVRAAAVCGAAVGALLIKGLIHMLAENIESNAVYSIINWCLIAWTRPFVIAPFLLFGGCLIKILQKASCVKNIIYIAAFCIINVAVSVMLKFKVAVVNVDFDSVLFFYIAGITGTAAVSIVCKAAEGKIYRPAENLLERLGISSMFIMLTHEYLGVREGIQNIAESILPTPFDMIITFALVVCAELVLIWLAEPGMRKLQKKFCEAVCPQILFKGNIK